MHFGYDVVSSAATPSLGLEQFAWTLLVQQHMLITIRRQCKRIGLLSLQFLGDVDLSNVL